MNGIHLSSDDVAVLTALANGIIPPDARDDGAAAVAAGPRIADRVNQGINAAFYIEGLRTACALAQEKFDCDVPQLAAEKLHELLGLLEGASPGFFRQLRADVCAQYMSDPGVWERIGFPGPSTSAGGYPDFDQRP